jgi:RNA polymerase primary sigma factor
MWSRNRSIHTGAALGAFGAGGEGHFVRKDTPASTQAGSPVEESELALVNAVLSGDGLAARRLLDRVSATVWSAVIKLEGGGPDGEAAFLHVVAALKADGYARLRNFDGRSRLTTYLTLATREILADRLARRFSEQPGEAWRRFSRFFESDIRRRVAHRMPRSTSEAAREDIYQDICLALIDDNYHRIRSYGGRGSFAGYILTIVDRILIDLIRRDSPRKRLPAAIARLAPLDQAVYAAIAWEGCPHDIARLAAALRGRLERDPQAGEIADALARVVAEGRLERAPPRSPYDMVSLDALVEDAGDLPLADSAPTPEDHLLLAEEEASRGAIIAAIKQAAADLPADQRLYLQIVFSASDPLPARDIARVMGYPVEEVYRLKQRTQRWLKEVATRLNIKSGPSV